MREGNGHETERANQGNGSGGLYFAVAPGDSDSGFTFIFSAAWLHLEGRKAGESSLAGNRSRGPWFPARLSVGLLGERRLPACSSRQLAEMHRVLECDA